MSSTAARRVAQLNAHLTDAPVDQIQRFPTAAVRSRPDPARAPMRRNNARRPKSPRLQASALPRQHAPTHTDDPTPSHQHHVTQRKSPDDIVVVSALRTPITRAKKGGLKDTPADDLVVRQMPNWADYQSVFIGGEVNSPGSYAITKEDTLGSLIARAGGLTASADPRAAIFLREELRESEQRALDELRSNLERQSISSMKRWTF